MSIEFGNLNTLNEENPDRGGWFVGSFIPEDSLLHSEKCEAKYAYYKKGFKKDSGLDLGRESRTIGILLSGRFKLHFFEERQDVILEKPGDFVAFEGLAHDSEALEDCTVFVIRWYP